MSRFLYYFFVAERRVPYTLHMPTPPFFSCNTPLCVSQHPSVNFATPTFRLAKIWVFGNQTPYLTSKSLFGLFKSNNDLFKSHFDLIKPKYDLIKPNFDLNKSKFGFEKRYGV